MTGFNSSKRPRLVLLGRGRSEHPPARPARLRGRAEPLRGVDGGADGEVQDQDHGDDLQVVFWKLKKWLENWRNGWMVWEVLERTWCLVTNIKWVMLCGILLGGLNVEATPFSCCGSNCSIIKFLMINETSIHSTPKFPSWKLLLEVWKLVVARQLSLIVSGGIRQMLWPGKALIQSEVAQFHTD